ncbi:MAG: dihydropteroate synthase [Pseudomonadota bacterium]|nr:dihydropteroate synthase [Pseudomonadota bacterium]
MVQVVGILNVTPDSFYDGGHYDSVDSAKKQVEKMISAGADMIDIGCESTRPGSNRVTAEEEIKRLSSILPFIRSMTTLPISVDTYKPEVMAYAISEGVDMINDIYALRTPGALEVVAKHKVKVCLMHLNGSVETMHEQPNYDNVTQTVCDFFSSRISACEKANIDLSRIVLDPGFGFSKKPSDNFKLLKELDHFEFFNLPIYIGISRKRFVGSLLNENTPNNRLIGSLIAASWACQQGADYIRTHDVAETKEAIDMASAILNG